MIFTAIYLSRCSNIPALSEVKLGVFECLISPTNKITFLIYRIAQTTNITRDKQFITERRICYFQKFFQNSLFFSVKTSLFDSLGSFSPEKFFLELFSLFAYYIVLNVYRLYTYFTLEVFHFSR